MRVIVRSDYEKMSRMAALEVARLLNSKPDAVLGLATGSSPLGLYQELIRMHREEGLDFSKVTTFNLDEYVGLTPDNPQSYYYFMQENLFRHINVAPQNIHVPSGTTDNYEKYCDWYEERIVNCGGIDLQILGIGVDGHIAFNEPSSSLGSRTRIKTLAKQTISDNARFFDRPEDVPVYAVTMGVGTILEAKSILLLAQGSNKSEAVAAAIEGPVTSMVTASALQLHHEVACFLDEAAATDLQMLDYYRWIEEKQEVAPKAIPRPHLLRRSATPARARLE